MSRGSIENIQFSLARIVSVAFHPLFMPLYGLGIIFSTPTLIGFLPFNIKKIIFSIVLINNVLIPLILLPFFRNRNIITSYNIEERHERTIPLFVTSVFYSITCYIILRFQLPLFLKSFILAITILVAGVTIINFWWKISLHAAGIGAINAVVFVLMTRMYVPLTVFPAAAIISAGLVLSSRLKLNMHNPAQVWISFLTGFAGLILSMSVL